MRGPGSIHRLLIIFGIVGVDRLNRLKVLAQCVRHFYIFFFSYLLYFSNKMLATDAKTQKIKPDPIFFYDGRKFLTQREVVFIF